MTIERMNLINNYIMDMGLPCPNMAVIKEKNGIKIYERDMLIDVISGMEEKEFMNEISKFTKIEEIV